MEKKACRASGEWGGLVLAEGLYPLYFKRSVFLRSTEVYQAAGCNGFIDEQVRRDRLVPFLFSFSFFNL